MWKCWTNSNYAYKFYLPFDFEISDYMVFLPRSTLTHLPPLSMVTLCRYLGSKNRHSSVMLIRQLILIDLIEWLSLYTHTHLQTCLFGEYCCYITWYLFDFWGFIPRQYVGVKSQENNISPFWYVASTFKDLFKH